jgi:site-specific DNA recombinase
MRTVVYVRVSTLRQAQAQTIEQQLDRLRTCFRARGAELTSEDVFRDDGYSGATLNRPGLDRLRDAARAGEIERVLVTDPDRLARNYVQLMVLLEELERLGYEVEFLDRPMGRDPQDQLLLQIRGAVAEYERTLIAERMRRGRQAKLRAGCLLPWTHPPYGYRLDPDRPRDPAGVTVEPAEAAVVREMFARYAEDHASLFSLAKHLHALGIGSPTDQPHWSAATLHGILTNPAYTGQVYAGRWRARPPRVRRSATHPTGRASDSLVAIPADQWLPVASIPALVSPDQFGRVQAKLAQNRAFASRNNTRHDYLLRALVSCGVCRSSCVCRTAHPGYDYYACRAKFVALRGGTDEPCPARYTPVHQLDELVWRDLCTLLSDPEHIAQALARAHGGGWLPQELQARRDQLCHGQLGLERQLERLTEAYQLGVIPLAEYQRRRQAVEDRAQALRIQADQLEAQVDRTAQLAGWAGSATDFCRRVQAGLDQADFAQRRQLVELLIDRVVVTDDEVEIRYVIPIGPDGERGRFCQLRKDYFDAPPLGIRLDDGGCGQRRVSGQQQAHLGPAGALRQLAADHPDDDTLEEARATHGMAQPG